MVDGSHREHNVKIVFGTSKTLNGVRENCGLRQVEFFCHQLKSVVSLAGVITAFSHRLQTDRFSAMKSCPKAQHSLATADLKHCLALKIYFSKKLCCETREIKAMVP